MNTSKLQPTEVARIEAAVASGDPVEYSQEDINGVRVFVAFAGKRQVFVTQTQDSFDTLKEQTKELYAKTQRVLERERKKEARKRTLV